MHPSGIVKALRAFAKTLQVVEMVDVAIFGLTGFEPTIDLVLRCLKDDLHIRTLVLDGIRVWEDDHTERPGMTVAKAGSETDSGRLTPDLMFSSALTALAGMVTMRAVGVERL